MRVYSALAAVVLIASPAGAQRAVSLRPSEYAIGSERVQADSVSRTRAADSVMAGARLLSRFKADVGDSKRDSYALIGLVAGGVAGLLVDTARNFAADTPEVCTTTPCTTKQATLSPPFGTSILIGAGVGLLVGAVVGTRYHESQFGIAPDSRGGVTVSAHASW